MSQARALKFAPLSMSLFPDEYRQLKEAAEGCIAGIKADANNWQRTGELTAQAKDDLAWLAEQQEKRPGDRKALQAEVDKLMAEPRSYRVNGLTPEAKGWVEAWRKRIEEIDAALSGRVAG